VDSTGDLAARASWMSAYENGHCAHRRITSSGVVVVVAGAVAEDFVDNGGEDEDELLLLLLLEDEKDELCTVAEFGTLLGCG